MVDAMVQAEQHHVFLAHSEESLNQDMPVCELIEYRRGQWSPIAAWDWQAVALVDLPGDAASGLVVLGRDGQIGCWSDGQASELVLDPEFLLGPFRGMRRFGTMIVAYGMGREVYLRQAGGDWVRSMLGIDPGVGQPSLRPGGFNGMAVDSKGLLTAAGRRGEIWVFEGGTWRRVDTPTNIMLHDLVACDDGQLYACGLAGTLLAGQGDTWGVVDFDGPALDFLAAGWFNGRLYLADGHSLRVMSGNVLDLVDHGTEEIVPCSAIASGPGVMLSIAGQEVWESQDGLSWQSILG
ncbi:MAG: hypothetical protein FWD63_05495 [Propionibacteriaceae bacterium]|nr:hypothetical protein [Propionibacteriaceae bacterium]